MNYAEENVTTDNDLRQLAILIDAAYRFGTKDNDKASEILEDFIENGFAEETKKEDSIGFTYGMLRKKLDWEDFCDLIGLDYYAIRKGHIINNNDIYEITEITETKVKKLGLL